MPISSHQVAGMIGGQQAMFGNFASYAQQISPGGGYGTPTYGNPMAGVGTGMSTPFEDPMVENFGTRAMSAAGNIGLPALGTAALIGGSLLPGAAGRFIGGLDPFSAGLSGFARGAGLRAGGMGIMGNLGRIASGGIGSIARAGVGGIAGGLMAAAPMLAAGAGIQYGVGQMVQGAQYENQVGGFLQNQFRFLNAGSETGYGFNRQQRGEISGMMREMGHQDMMSSPQEMMRVLQAGTGMGVFRAVQDARQFKSKFKEMVGALKEISEVMNTTLEGAVPFLAQSRQQGFWTPQDIMRNAQMAKTAASSTGMSVAQAQQMMGQGASMARQVGALGAHGAEGMARTMGMVGGALRGGYVNEAQLSEITGGLQGPEAVQAVAGSMQASATRFAASRTGRWMLAALGRDGFRGLDAGRLRAFARGDISIGQIGGMARSNIAKQGAFNFVQNEEELRGELLKKGPEAQLGLIRGLMGGSLYGESSRDKYITRRMMGRFFGAHGREADLKAEMLRNLPQIMEENERRSSAEMDQQSRDRDRVMETSWEGVKRRASKWWDSNVKEPMQQFGADISRRITRWWEHATDKFWGVTPARQRLQGITQEGMEAIQAGTMGDRRQMELMFGRPGEMEKQLGQGGLGLGLVGQGIGRSFKGQGGLGRGLLNMAANVTLSGDFTNDTIETLSRMGVQEYGFETKEERDRKSQAWGLTSGAERGAGRLRYRAMSKADVERAVSGLRAANSGIVGARAASALGFESEKAASSAIEAAQRDMGDKDFKANAQRLAFLTGKTGRDLGEAMVKEIEAHRMGGDNLRKLLSGSRDMMTKVHRLAAAQTPEMRKAYGGISLEGEAEALGMVDVLGFQKQAQALDKMMEKHTEDLASAISGPEPSRWRKFWDPVSAATHAVSKSNVKTGMETLSSGAHGSEFRKAVILMGRGTQEDQAKAVELLAKIGEDKGLSAGERSIVTSMLDPTKRKSMQGVLGSLAGDFQMKNELSFREVVARRRQRMFEGANKISDKTISALNAVQGKGGVSVGSAIEGLRGAETSQQYETKLRKLMDVAGGLDEGQAEAAAQLLEETEGGTTIASAIRATRTTQRDVELLTKRGGGRKVQGLQAEALSRQLGTRVTTQDVQKLMKGDEKVQDRILGQFTNETSRRNAQQILQGFRSGERTNLASALTDRQAARELQKLSDKEGALTIRKKMETANSLEMGQGTPKAMHAEMIKQTHLLEQLLKKPAEGGTTPEPAKPGATGA